MARQSENERGQKRSSSCTARRGQQDWKRPMLDRDQLLSPTCLVDSQIIARSLHGPRKRCLRYLSVESILKDKVKIIRQVLRIIISLKIVSELFKATENAEVLRMPDVTAKYLNNER